MLLSSRRGPDVNTQPPDPKGLRTDGVDVGVEAATRLPVRMVAVAGQAIDDAPERSGSENRHDDVRESKSQKSHSQVVASE